MRDKMYFTSNLVKVDKYGWILSDKRNYHNIKINTTMSKNFNQQREELSPEGKRLWDAMMGEMEVFNREKLEEQVAKVKAMKKAKPVVIDESEQVQKMRLELKKLQQNSRIVVQECNKLQKEYVKNEQYFKANECRVAAFCHQNFIDRIQRVLDGQQAFDDNALNLKLEQDIDNSTDDRIQIQ